MLYNCVCLCGSSSSFCPSLLIFLPSVFAGPSTDVSESCQEDISVKRFTRFRGNKDGDLAAERSHSFRRVTSVIHIYGGRWVKWNTSFSQTGVEQQQARSQNQVCQSVCACLLLCTRTQRPCTRELEKTVSSVSAFPVSEICWSCFHSFENLDLWTET